MTRVATPRRIDSGEERLLRRSHARVLRNEQRLEDSRLERDRMIAALVNSGARQVDIAAMLELSMKTVRAAVDRGQL